MRIQQRRIHNVENYLHALPQGSQFQITLTDIDQHHRRLVEIGFSDSLNSGERVLPRAIGPVSRFNADGYNRPERDMPLETHYREGMIQDWHGYWHHVDIPYKRYPRTHIPAPSEELTIALHNGEKVITSRTFEYLPDNPQQLEIIKHRMNLFFELFGECTIQSDVLLQLRSMEIERRNWRVLPTGEYPWERAQNLLSGVTRNLSESRRRIVDSRFQHISRYKPSKLIIGQAGFEGYVVFCVANLGAYVLESRYTNNATYVFGDDWEALSQLSKGEILNGDLHRYRFIHLGQWLERVDALLNIAQAA